MLGGADVSCPVGLPVPRKGVYYLVIHLADGVLRGHFLAAIAPTLWYKSLQ